MVKRLLLAALAAFLRERTRRRGRHDAPSSRIAFGLDLGGLSGDLTQPLHDPIRTAAACGG